VGSIFGRRVRREFLGGLVFVYAFGRVRKGVISDPAKTANDLFGISMASQGGNCCRCTGNTGSKGAAYYFTEVNGGWREKTTLTAANGEGCSTTVVSRWASIYGDYFGDSVALGSE